MLKLAAGIIITKGPRAGLRRIFALRRRALHAVFLRVDCGSSPHALAEGRRHGRGDSRVVLPRRSPSSSTRDEIEGSRNRPSASRLHQARAGAIGGSRRNCLRRAKAIHRGFGAARADRIPSKTWSIDALSVNHIPPGGIPGVSWRSRSNRGESPSRLSDDSRGLPAHSSRHGCKCPPASFRSGAERSLRIRRARRPPLEKPGGLRHRSG